MSGGSRSPTPVGGYQHDHHLPAIAHIEPEPALQEETCHAAVVGCAQSLDQPGLIVVLPRNDRYRLTVLEAVMRRTDGEFVARMERITGMLLPPAGQGAPAPLDDVIPARVRANSTVSAAKPPPGTRLRNRWSWFARSWPQVVALLCAGFVVALGISASTAIGTVVCAVATAVLVVLVGHRRIGRAFTDMGRVITSRRSKSAGFHVRE